MSKWKSLPQTKARASAARTAAPHINSCRYSGFNPTISDRFTSPEKMNPSIASEVGSRISPCGSNGEILLPTSDAMLGFIFSGLVKRSEMVGLNPEYLHELMWGAAVRAALARALVCGKLFHFDINDGYRLKHDVDIAIGLVNPLDWLNVLVLLRAHDYKGPFNLDYKPPRTTSNYGVWAVSVPTMIDRFITLWEMAGEVISDVVIKEATDALKAGGLGADTKNAESIVKANKELLSLHELIAHRIFQILIGAHRGRTYSL